MLSNDWLARRRVAFTLIELLVVIAIIAVLIGLLLPAVQKVREAAARMKCANNLKQLALAVHNYENNMGHFPPGYVSNIASPTGMGASELSVWSWGAFILPYVEQQNLYNTLQVNERTLAQALATPEGLAAAQTPLSLFVCPSDTGPPLNDFGRAYASISTQFVTYEKGITTNGTNLIPIAKSNYVGVASIGDSTTPISGDFVSYGPPVGVFYHNSATKFADITDGTSNTAMLGERCYRLKGLLIGAGNVLGASPAATLYPSRNRAILSALGIPYWGINQTTINTFHQNRSFSSLHPRGVQFALCDGSVRFVNDNIDFRGNSLALGWSSANLGCDSTLERLLSRNDGQALGNY